jgi:hypothetical protein
MMDGRQQSADAELDDLVLLQSSSGASTASQYTHSDLVLLAALSTIREDGNEFISWSGSWVSAAEISAVAPLTATLDAAEKAMMDEYFDHQPKTVDRELTEFVGSTRDPPEVTSREDDLTTATMSDDGAEWREQPTFDSMMGSEASTASIGQMRMIKTLRILEEPPDPELFSTSDVVKQALIDLAPTSNSRSDGQNEDEVSAVDNYQQPDPVLRTVRSWATAPPSLPSHLSAASSSPLRTTRNSEALKIALATLAQQRNLPRPMEIPTKYRSVPTKTASITTTSADNNNVLDPVAAQQWKDRITEVKAQLRRHIKERKLAEAKQLKADVALPTISEDHEESHHHNRSSNPATKKQSLDTYRSESSTSESSTTAGPTRESPSEGEDDDDSDDTSSSRPVNLEQIHFANQAQSTLSSLCTMSTNTDPSGASTANRREESGNHNQLALQHCTFSSKDADSNKPRMVTRSPSETRSPKKILFSELSAHSLRSFSSADEDAILTIMSTSGSTETCSSSNLDRPVPLPNRSTNPAIPAVNAMTPPESTNGTAIMRSSPTPALVSAHSGITTMSILATEPPPPRMGTVPITDMDKVHADGAIQQQQQQQQNMQLLGVMILDSEDTLLVDPSVPRKKLIDAILWSSENQEAIETAFIDMNAVQQREAAAVVPAFRTLLDGSSTGSSRTTTTTTKIDNSNSAQLPKRSSWRWPLVGKKRRWTNTKPLAR